ncbi:hypothetical protein BD410DRAFT_817789 [Rickenella mellea]|uniref:Nuclear pore complex protein Nup160 n=1 Tax=Rickenella mellea TaxID=50990 RepID=A0A4R5XF76_9AGAM|nr:hypothetical protein BD410DRAFT_817789 [Rickenella mellea]
MNQNALIAVHLSSLFTSSSHVTTHAVPTARRDIPLAGTQSQSGSGFLDGHASYTSLFHSPITGNVLLRVVQSGLAVELISMSTSVPPVRFIFPASILPSPALVLWRNSQIHLLVVTSVGSLHRVILPIIEGGQLWHEPLRKDWSREWRIKKLGSNHIKLVHVQDFYSVVLGLDNGGILRLDADFVDEEQYNEHWNESEYRLNTWLASLLPTLPSSSTPSEVISLASLPPPTDDTDMYSFSRDRVLRCWSISKGCRAEITVNPGGGQTAGTDKSSMLLEPRAHKLLQVYQVKGPKDSPEGPFVLVFIPTPTSVTCGGYFQSYLLNTGQWQPNGSCTCSDASVHWKMQDFSLVDGTLHILWEKQGAAMMEMGHFDTGKDAGHQEIAWRSASYVRDTEFSQTDVDDLLLQPGALADKFLQAIFHPGVFSSLTLHGAIRDYTEHYLSLPGPHPPELSISYATLSENIASIVGCTVELTRDPQTDVLLYKQYWSSLRRDWEGFIARCREIERSARWPLALGVESAGRPVLIERERVAESIEEDTPLKIQRQLKISSMLDPGYSLLETAWVLKSKLSKPLMRRIEDEVLNILGQEFAFPLADIVGEASNRAFSREDLDEGIESWATTRFSAIEDVDQAIRTTLDIIGGLEKAVKQEEDEVELIIPPPTSEWSRALITAYTSETVEARYELCLALTVALFFFGDDLSGYDPTLLAEVFAVFRGVTMLRFLCHQPAGDPDSALPNANDTTPGQGPEDVITRFSNLHMSRGVSNPTPTYSLLHRLLAQTGHASVLPAAAHDFLDQTGLLSTLTPANATKSEVLICERLRVLGYKEATKQLLAWLPRTPAVSYVLGRLWIDTGRPDDAVLVLQGVAGCFGSDGALSAEDIEALTSVLPGAQLFPSEFAFYLHVAELFRSQSLISNEITFTKLALEVSPAGVDVAALWATIIKGYTDLGLYEDAYAAIIVTPHDKIKQHCVEQLVFKMCEDDVIDRLMALNFGELAKDVEAALSFKARNADPRIRPPYAQILYTWHVLRGEYRNGASVMYLRARRLSELQGDPAQTVSLADQQADALVVATNALSITDPKSAWIVVHVGPGSSKEGWQSRKRRKLESFIPAEKFGLDHRDVEIVTLSDMQQEYALLCAKLALSRKDLLGNGGKYFAMSPWVAVSKLTQAGLFDIAMATGRILEVDMTELFQRLAIQCLRLTAAPDPSLLEIAADWLLTDKVSSWPGTTAERGWRYLRQSLERHDSAETDFRYSKAVFETLLSYERGRDAPPWLVASLEEHHPDHLIRACLKYDLIDDALDHTLNLVRKAKASASRTPSKQAGSTWLPYTVIDAVVNAAETWRGGEDTVRTAKLRDAVLREVNDRIKRVGR